MRFSQEMIEAIVEDRKSQTRRLVKEDDYSVTNPIDSQGITHVISSKLKWQVGRDYAVQDESGKAVWWCKKCKGTATTKYPKSRMACGDCYSKLSVKKSLTEVEMMPLRIRITQIRKEILLDISNSDINAEGFKSRSEFYSYFFKIYGKFKVAPHVWGISFSVVKD